MSYASVLFLAVAGLIGVNTASGATGNERYVASTEAARRARVAELLKPDGWLTLIGLEFLEPGDNPIAADGVNLGTARLAPDNQVTITRAASAPATVDLIVLERGGKKALRIKDRAAPALKNFQKLDYFPIDPSWRVEARWVPYSTPQAISVTNVLGQTSQETAPGKAVFERGGKTYELVPVVEGPGEPLFFILGDSTSGHETYQMRFLYAALPKDGKVILDFNLTENPPCAFTDYATCPLPPKGNRLPLAITAGEKSYRGHHD